MSYTEIFPALMGFVLGALLGRLGSTHRRWLVIPFVVFIGVAATIASGEIILSWYFLLVDVSLVAITTFAGWAAQRAFQEARQSHTTD